MQQQVTRERDSLVAGNELVDAHCHLDMFPDPKTTATDAKFGGVNLIITSGGNRAASLAAIKVSDGKLVFSVIGVDPEGAKDDSKFVDEIAGLVKSHRTVVGIGEIGLDYKIDTDRELQQKVFEKQIEIAKSLDIPVVIHSRQAIEEVTETIIRLGVKKAMFHYFEGDEQQAKALAERGYLISIPPIESSRRRRVINALSIDSIAVETDSPVVGKSPLDVIRIVEWIAEIKGIPFGEASLRIMENIKRLFSL